MKYIKYIFSVLVIIGSFLIIVPNVKANTNVDNVFNNVIQWEAYYTVLDEDENFYDLQVAKIQMDSTFRQLSYNNLLNYYQIGMPSNIFQMYLLDTSYNHYIINDLDYDSWYNEKYLPFINIQMFSLTASPNVKMSYFGYNGLNDLNNDIASFLGGYPNDSGNWYLIRYLKAVDRDSYDLGYNDGYDVGYGNGYDKGKNDFGYDDNGTIIPGENAYDKGYFKGTQESGELKARIIDFIPGVLGSIFMFFFQIGQIGILGITILDILGMIILISGLIFLIKFFF